MPRDASGAYTAPSNGFNPAVPFATISSAAWNAQLADYTATLTDSLSRSGDGEMLADLPMGGFKVTGAANGVASDDLATLGQLTAIYEPIITTLGVSRGGTGQTTYTNGQLLIGNTTGNTLTKATLTAGGGVTITNGTGSITVGTTPGQLPGTSTNDAATAGNIGQYISSSIDSGSALAFTTATARNITSISLTAGDWDVWVNARFTGATTTTLRAISASISTTSATLDASVGRVAAGFYNGQTPFTDANLDVGVGPTRVSLASTTTIYFVAQAVFGVSTCSGFGIIHARRVR